MATIRPHDEYPATLRLMTTDGGTVEYALDDMSISTLALTAGYAVNSVSQRLGVTDEQVESFSDATEEQLQKVVLFEKETASA